VTRKSKQNEIYKFEIPGELSDLNKIISVSKKHWSNYAELKRTETELVAFCAFPLPTFEKIDIHIKFYCKNMKRDPDGMLAGLKPIFDGLVVAKKIRNDGWKHIGNISFDFEVDKRHPRIEVRLKEIGRVDD
jgi:hypothetical protein